MSIDIDTLTQQMAEMTTRVAALEKALKKSSKATKSTTEDQPKKPMPDAVKPWNAFQARVAAVLKEADASLGAYATNMQFCSFLKAIKADYDEWDNDEILEHRESWSKPEKSKMQLNGKGKRPPPMPKSTSASSESESDEETVKKAAKKAVKRAAKAATPVVEPPTPVVEDDEYDGGYEPIKIKGKMFQITDKNDVIDEDNYTYIGHYNKETKVLNKEFPQPAYVKKLLAELKEANE